MIFRVPLQIRFAHCDPAGIVFYPRYFEMLNSVVEDWCAQGLGMDFRTMHMAHQLGLPTVHLEVDFVQASQLGDMLEAQLRVVRVGTSSVELAVSFFGMAQTRQNPEQQAQPGLRMKIKQVLVWMDLQKRSAQPLPDQLRSQMMKYIDE
jgi:4-hydroxybenzoyl-CoA thioesterase